MIWWLRIRYVPAVAIGLLSCILLGSGADSVTVPIPVVIGGLTFDLPMSSLLPLVPVCLILEGQARADAVAERVAVRAMGGWDAAFMAACVLVCALAAVATSTAGAGNAATALARDFAGYLGLALIIRWLGGARLATVATALFPFLCVSFGLVHNRPGIWAWPLHDATSVTASTQALILLAVGAVSLFLPPLRRHDAVNDE
ncbi:hypothetical protein ACIPLC_27765 [Kitasatospora sp. NPDC086801]|uniref:hypothetical protein n=1 Tax=Kitasatospora sp. NPDC086801 TaxID=3364066 RepID=UPI00381CADD5